MAEQQPEMQQKVESRLTPEPPKPLLFFQTRDELAKVDVSKVIYFKSEGNYTKVVFANNHEVMVSNNLGKIESLIDEKLRGRVRPFIRIGKCFIVNTAFICQINVLRQQLVLTDCVSPNVYTLSVSKDALKNLREIYIEKGLWK